MIDAKFRYVGPAVTGRGPGAKVRPLLRRLPIAFLITVVAPTLVAAIYFLLVASPRYVSEAQFVVRRANQDQPTALGMTLQGVGLAPAQSDVFLVHTFVSSRDGLRYLGGRESVAELWGQRTVDPISRYPRAWEARSFEAMYRAYKRFVVVGYDSMSGVSTLRVQAFRAEDAQRAADALLDGGELLINQLNERAAGDAVRDAQRSTAEARARLVAAQNRLAEFRNRERFIDPELVAREGSDLVGRLTTELALVRARRDQLVAEAPESPQIPALNGQIRAFERQIAEVRDRLAGDVDSLAPKVGVYEGLVLERELADRALAATTQAETLARDEARRQRLYLDRVVNPNLPDVAAQPKRLRSILAVFATCLLFYGVGWLIAAGVRETRQV